jgi:hypothetical protein
MAVAGNIRAVNDGDGYVVVDLPVRLTPGELAKLTGMSVKAATSARRGNTTFASSDPGTMDARDRAVELIDLRTRREQALGPDLFGEPAWDLMLDLFVRYVDGRRTSTKSAAVAARAPISTALRYLNLLVDKGWVDKLAHPNDLRIQYVTLSPVGYHQMLALLQGRI